MAKRPVYYSVDKYPYVKTIMCEFVWNGGFAKSQKQKNIIALHETFKRHFPNNNILEISSKSLQELGIQLSAFNLLKYVPSLNKSIPVECIFQGGKVFRAGGPYLDLYEKTAKEAKKDERLKNSGMLKEFYFDNKIYPNYPKTAFYDYIYIQAILENKEIANEVLKFNAFTDIEFNPEKSSNCQARACALYVSLANLNLLDYCKDFNTFITLY